MASRVYTLRKRDLRLAASLILIAASVVLLAWGFWPEGRTVQVLRLDSPEAENAAGAHPVRALRLEYPASVRLNDRAVVRLSFEVLAEGAAPRPTSEIQVNPIDEPAQPIAEARLEMPDAIVRPPDSIYEALAPGRSLEFYWSVVLSAPGEYRGTAWSFLTMQGSVSSPIALGAQNVQMRSVSLLGMSGEAARIIGGLSLIGGLVLALPFIDPAARWLSRGGTRGV